MNILIVSGFLGSGKTTFIKKLIEATQKKVAIFENEYGEVDIDSNRLSNNKNIWEMAQGCICCSLKKDFASSILTVANTVDLKYLIVEPTGLGKLSEILKNIKQIEYERIKLLSPICIVDFNLLNTSFKQYPNLFIDQIINSDTIIISKAEKASSDELEAFKNVLSKYNNKASIFTYGDLNKSIYNSFFLRMFDGTLLTEEKDDVLPDSYCIRNFDFKNISKLILFLEKLIRNEFGHIIRAKGHVKCNNQQYDIDVVDGYYSITDLGLNSKSNIVFIGSNINRNMISKYIEINKHKLIYYKH